MSVNTAVDYSALVAQATALTQDEPDLIANLSNISALIFHTLPQLNWAGFYLLKEQTLVLGPFQGKVACMRIPVGKGVCGTAVATGEVQRVADVHAFDGHIACDGDSNAEIVLPIRVKHEIVAVLDIDSPIFDRFSHADHIGLASLVDEVISHCFSKQQ